MLNGDKLLMTLLVRNEQDILPHALEFHRAQGVDHFIVTDNLSNDLTRDILRHYESMGWLTWFEEYSDDYDQEEWVSRMARIATEPQFSAGWVIHSDADEFWVAGSGTLREFFSSIDTTTNIVSAKRHNFVCTRDSPAVWHENMVYRKTKSLNYRGRPLPDKVAHRPYPNVRVEQGNHGLSGIVNPKVKYDGLEILHFPVRSLEQIEQKIRLGGAAYTRNNRQSPEVGLGWRKLYEELNRVGNLQSYFEENSIEERALPELIDRKVLVLDERIKCHFANKSVNWCI